MYNEAMASRDVAFRKKKVVNDEMDSIISNGTQVSIDLLLGSKAIGCKWVFRRIYKG